MNRLAKSRVLLAMFALTSLSAVSGANASSDRDQRIQNEQLQACITEIRQHANYESASRVVHRVSGFDQRNFWKMKIRIETLVYGIDDNIAVREYAVSCITVTTGDVYRFRIESVRGA